MIVNLHVRQHLVSLRWDVLLEVVHGGRNDASELIFEILLLVFLFSFVLLSTRYYLTFLYFIDLTSWICGCKGILVIFDINRVDTQFLNASSHRVSSIEHFQFLVSTVKVMGEIADHSLFYLCLNYASC